jgi:hypothetical protein
MMNVMVHLTRNISATIIHVRLKGAAEEARPIAGPSTFLQATLPTRDGEDHECGGAASLLFTGMEPATSDDLPPTWSTTRRPLA